MRAAKVTLLAALAQLAAASYELMDDYNPSNFFDKFEFFSGRDPSNGYVAYQGKEAALSSNLAQKLENSIRIGSDSTDIATGPGRRSVRLETKARYKHGLIVADIKHMPGSICGIWPAFWTVGSRWPEHGEMDIIEGVNRQSINKMALHTTAGCKINSNGDFTGVVETPDCDVNSPNQAPNQGCLFTSSQGNSYGTNFNNRNGGVYAMEWTSDEITVWFFPRGNIPDDVNSQNPDPSKWGKPSARFSGDCDLDRFVQDQRIIFNTAFCGDWAKGLWNSDSVCRAKGPSCEDYVKNNPKDFAEAYWEIYGMKVYSKGQGQKISSAATSPTQASTTQVSTTQISSAQSASASASVSDGPDTSSNTPPSATESGNASPIESRSTDVEPTKTPTGTDGGASLTNAPCNGPNCPSQSPTTSGGVSPTDKSEYPANPGTTGGSPLPTNKPEIPSSCTPRTTCVTYTRIETVTYINKNPAPFQTGVQSPTKASGDDESIIPIR
ncbi:mixed-linked glucanase [Coccidioides immitis H538.4]|uniref:endo-1,3(4)-beta-glucanase n=1 Tax=Coccidioides immitis H538.4 TaxID=396776 RepID=A0A0J8S3L5_COCIT|nr:mixed-linked glucanase [Coccidioides immitis H538.4]